MTVRPLTGESETLKVAATVPLFPSATVTLSTESEGSGSSSVIVPTPWPSAIVAFERRSGQEEGLVRLVEQVAVDRHGDGLRRLAGGEVERATDSGEVAGRNRRVVRGRVVTETA